MALNEKQQRFVEEYLIDLNATQAAIRAGYAPTSAGNHGHRLLKNNKVVLEIEKAIAIRARRTGVSQDRVIRELAKIAFINAKEVINVDTAEVLEDASEDDTAAIASIKVKIIPTANGDGTEREVKFVDKLRALELLGKHLAIFDGQGGIANLNNEDDPLTKALKEAFSGIIDETD